MEECVQQPLRVAESVDACSGSRGQDFAVAEMKTQRQPAPTEGLSMWTLLLQDALNISADMITRDAHDDVDFHTIIPRVWGNVTGGGEATWKHHGCGE